MQLVMIVGPTASGKTSAATAYARQTDAPVVVMDRFQCYPELAVMSGRPSEHSLGATTRVYLDDRRLVDGEFSTADAFAALLEILSQLATHEPLVIVEGGSLSLFDRVASTLDSLPYSTTIRVRNVDVESVEYRAGVRQRVATMLGIESSETTLLHELRHAWRFEEHWDFLRSICGFDAVLSWCQDNGIAVSELHSEHVSPAHLDELVDRVSDAHYRYARLQVRAFGLPQQATALPGSERAFAGLPHPGPLLDAQLVETPAR